MRFKTMYKGVNDLKLAQQNDIALNWKFANFRNKYLMQDGWNMGGVRKLESTNYKMGRLESIN